MTDGKTDYKYTEIILPMPLEQIIDNHSHAIGSVSLSPIQAAWNLTGAILQYYTPISDKEKSKDPKDRRSFNPNNTDAFALGKSLFFAKTRTAINPIAEQLYQSPIPRTWTYTFNYVPTSAKEAEAFNDCIRSLKEHSYPTLTAEDLMYKMPGTCDFYFVTNDSLNGKIIKNSVLPYNKKPCFISDIQISYLNGTTTYTHFKDGNPTSTVVTLTLIETQLLSREDFYRPSERKLMSSGVTPTPE